MTIELMFKGLDDKRGPYGLKWMVNLSIISQALFMNCHLYGSVLEMLGMPC